MAGWTYRHVRSFRREEGGLYAVWVFAYSRIHRARMRWVHNHGRHGPLLVNGRCTWCGVKAGPDRLA
jgi:hypothetical protein